MYFRAQHPQAKSLSKDNLKLTMTALGGNLNDPEQMRQVLRVIGDRVTRQAADASAGYNLEPHAPGLSLSFPATHKVDIMRPNTLDPNNPYYITPKVQEIMRLDNNERIAPGQTIQEYVESPSGTVLVSTWYNLADGAAMLPEQILKRLKDADMGGVTLADLNDAEFNEGLAQELQERLGIINHRPEPIAIMAEPGNTVIMNEESVADWLEYMNEKAAAEGNPPVTLGPPEE
jgi:hypothetical protein